MIEIKVPDIGDFKNVEIIEVLIKEGDQIKKNDPILTLESDKSSVEVPSPFDGKISSIKVKVGDKVSKGSLIATLSNGDLSKIKDNKSILPETEKMMMRKIQKLYELKIKNAQKLYNFLFAACIHSFFKCLNIMEAEDRDKHITDGRIVEPAAVLGS
jgi:pyruvate/2-oxoglutarate dehydrogenase complex dihydrolipoamide acyltransferase (E2) component